MQHNASRAPHTFPLCLTCWWESERVDCVDRAHFSLFLWSECVTGDLFSQFSGGRSLFCWIWNIWSIRGPPSLFHIRGMAHSFGPVRVHNGSQIASAYCSSNWVTQTLWPLISLCNLPHSLCIVRKGKIFIDKKHERFTKRLDKWS